jgi:hypothetical protein
VKGVAEARAADEKAALAAFAAVSDNTDAISYGTFTGSSWSGRLPNTVFTEA